VISEEVCLTESAIWSTWSTRGQINKTNSRMRCSAKVDIESARCLKLRKQLKTPTSD